MPRSPLPNWAERKSPPPPAEPDELPVDEPPLALEPDEELSLPHAASSSATAPAAPVPPARRRKRRRAWWSSASSVRAPSGGAPPWAVESVMRYLLAAVGGAHVPGVAAWCGGTSPSGSEPGAPARSVEDLL